MHFVARKRWRREGGYSRHVSAVGVHAWWSIIFLLPLPPNAFSCTALHTIFLFRSLAATVALSGIADVRMSLGWQIF